MMEMVEFTQKSGKKIAVNPLHVVAIWVGLAGETIVQLAHKIETHDQICPTEDYDTTRQMVTAALKT
jgi:hypothetical protein